MTYPNCFLQKLGRVRPINVRMLRSPEVNVGGMNVRVFEMDLTDDKKEDAIL